MSISRTLPPAVCGLVAALLSLNTALAQGPPDPATVPRPAAAPTAPIERVGPNLLRIGKVNVDTAKKEVSVTGVVTTAMTLEFIAAKKGGNKAYESALELDTDAMNFNVGLILIGLDPARGRFSRYHFDPELPAGDPVDVWVEWDEADATKRRVRAEELVYNTVAKSTLSEGPWVYTGSRPVRPDGTGFLAEVDGVLIGFVHTPAPMIESPRPLVRGQYGANRLNPNLNLKPGTTVRLTVRALPREKASGQ